jgi:type VI secretion system protein ImpF
MAKLDLPPGLLPSLKDRLLDPESMGTLAQPGYNLSNVLDSVRDDLEELLNTRRSLQVPAAQFPELAQSVATFGLKDLTSVGGSTLEKQEDIARMIEKAILLHEPRLQNVRAKVVKTRVADLRVRYHIDAVLRVDPAPAVAFETVVELTTGHVSIREGAG